MSSSNKQILDSHEPHHVAARAQGGHGDDHGAAGRAAGARGPGGQGEAAAQEAGGDGDGEAAAGGEPYLTHRPGSPRHSFTLL